MSSRKTYGWAAGALLAVSVAAVVVAMRTDPPAAGNPNDLRVGPAAPELHAQGWLNSPALGAKELAGKVVVYDFWTYSCINCVRTLPYVRSWFDRYQKDGLVVIGVHSPEFDFEKDHANVGAAVARLKVTWPVALDDGMVIWNDFGNRYWPAKYVADRQGRLRYVHPGEGAYRETEEVLRGLLGVGANSPRAVKPGDEKDGGLAEQTITPETYLGTDRGDVAQDGTHDYSDPGTFSTDGARLAGRWTADGERVRSAGPAAAIVLAYQAREVNLVMASEGGAPVDVLLDLDGKPLSPQYRTAQTMVDAEGRTFVRVTASDLYRLVLGPTSGGHHLRLTPRSEGLDAFAFTFGA